MSVLIPIETLLSRVDETKENLVNRSVSLYDILVEANDAGLGVESCRIVHLLNSKIIAAEEARIKVYWRTRWSSGPSSWEKTHFLPQFTKVDIEEWFNEEVRRDDEWSEHYRGYDYVIVQSWDTDPNTALNKVSV